MIHKSIQNAYFNIINEVLLGHRWTHSFLSYGCFCATEAGPSYYNWDNTAHKAWNIYYLAPYRKKKKIDSLWPIL